MQVDNVGVCPIRDQGSIYIDNKEKARLLNSVFQFFNNKGDIPLMLTESFTKSLREIDTEINGVIKLLNGFNPHKTIGPDNIHIRFLKET